MRKFKTESKKLLDLMINSIYTNREIFLRELISNASDAVDKLYFRSLTDKDVQLGKDELAIRVSFDKDARTVTVSDNGIGMTKDELDKNLGTIAHSDSMAFKADNAEAQGDDVDIIGQFGVGFYSAFMVAKKVRVVSRAFGSDEAWAWESDGVEGYTIEPAEREGHGTDVILTLKDNTANSDGTGESYDTFLSEYGLRSLIKRYSNYVRYPVQMEVSKTREKPKPEDAGDDYQPEYESYTELDTINSMIPIWKRGKSEVTDEEYNEFYKTDFHDFADPARTFSIHAEGALSYDALLFIPARAPYDLYSKDFKKGLALYSSNVLIMEKCEELLPDHYNFVRGVVDSQDLTLNISRETLQHNSQLRAIAKKVEKKITCRAEEDARQRPRGVRAFLRELRPRAGVRHLHQLRHAERRAGRAFAVLLRQAAEAHHAGRVPGGRAGRPEGHLLRRWREHRPPGQDAHREDGAGQGLRRAAVHKGRGRVLLPAMMTYGPEPELDAEDKPVEGTGPKELKNVRRATWIWPPRRRRRRPKRPPRKTRPCSQP